MNLIEVVMAALLVSLSAGSSLQIWSQISREVMQEERHQELAGRLDGELAALEANLRLHGLSSLRTVPCGSAAASLQTLLNARPASDGVQRRLTLLPSEDALLLELAVADSPIRRQRLLLPAALGLCAVPTTAPTPAPTPVPTPALPVSHG